MISTKASGIRPLLLVNIGQLLTLNSSAQGLGPRRGKALSELGLLEDAAILCSGGRIVSVGKTKDALRDPRRAGKSVLAEKVLHALHEMAEQGTTTIEAKSGYGLTVDSELKSLEAIRLAASRWPGTVVATLLGAHVIPKEFQGRSQKYVESVCMEMVPQAARRKLAQFVDVFCDRGAFSVEETRRIFEVAAQNGLGVRAHVGQLSESPLETLLAWQDTVATFVPGANYFLGLNEYPSARKFIDAGVPVALATDYNPGTSPTASMPFVMSLSCTHMKMSPAEAIAAATINGAWALRVQDHKGSIESGKDADLAVFDVEDYREIPYWFASNRCAFTVLNGVLVASGGSGELG